MPRQTKKLQTKATKGVIWARVSSREQEDGYSLDAQIENSKKYAERIGIEIIKTFEVTESSTHGDRKQFHDMINWPKTIYRHYLRQNRQAATTGFRSSDTGRTS